MFILILKIKHVHDQFSDTVNLTGKKVFGYWTKIRADKNRSNTNSTQNWWVGLRFSTT